MFSPRVRLGFSEKMFLEEKSTSNLSRSQSRRWQDHMGGLWDTPGHSRTADGFNVPGARDHEDEPERRARSRRCARDCVAACVYKHYILRRSVTPEGNARRFHRFTTGLGDPPPFLSRDRAVLVSVAPRFRSPSLTSPPRKRIVVVVVVVVITQVHV